MRDPRTFEARLGAASAATPTRSPPTSTRWRSSARRGSRPLVRASPGVPPPAGAPARPSGRARGRRCPAGRRPAVTGATEVSNGWIAFAASRRDAPGDGDGEFRDIYLTREGATGRRIIGSDGDGRSYACPRFSPDGSRMAYGDGDESGSGISTSGAGSPSRTAPWRWWMGSDGEPSAGVASQHRDRPGSAPMPDGARTAATWPSSWAPRSGSPTLGPASRRPCGWDRSPATFPASSSLDLECSPDGSSIAVTEAGRSGSMPIDGSRSHPPTGFPVAYARSLRYIADRRQVVYVTTDDAISSYGLVRAVDLDTGVDRVLRDDARTTGREASSPRRTAHGGVSAIPAAHPWSWIPTARTNSSCRRLVRLGPPLVTRWPTGALGAGLCRSGPADTITGPGPDLQPRMGRHPTRLLAGGRPVTRRSAPGTH